MVATQMEEGAEPLELAWNSSLGLAIQDVLTEMLEEGVLGEKDVEMVADSFSKNFHLYLKSISGEQTSWKKRSKSNGIFPPRSLESGHCPFLRVKTKSCRTLNLVGESMTAILENAQVSFVLKEAQEEKVQTTTSRLIKIMVS